MKPHLLLPSYVLFNIDVFEKKCNLDYTLRFVRSKNFVDYLAGLSTCLPVYMYFPYTLVLASCC